MTTQNIISLFKEKPYLLRMGTVNISKRLHCQPDQVKEARKIIRTGSIGTFEKLKIQSKLPKILVLDIETSPIKAWIWRLWKENIPIGQIDSDWFCLCWSAKWLFKSEVYSDWLTPEEALKEDDKRIMTTLRDLMEEADIIITYNGQRFDIPKANTRMLLNGLPPVKPFTHIDLFKHVKAKFGFASNKLDWLATKLGIPNKLSTRFELWRDCVNGKQEALNHMVKYNRYDVELLEDVYLKIRPWITNHPNIGLYLDTNESICPNCGSSLTNKVGDYYTSTGRYDLYRCECGAHARSRTSNFPKEIRSVLLSNNIK